MTEEPATPPKRTRAPARHYVEWKRAISIAFWRKRTYSDADVVALFDDGYSRKAIAKKLGVSVPPIAVILARYKRSVIGSAQPQTVERVPRAHWTAEQQRAYLQDTWPPRVYREWLAQQKLKDPN